MQLAGGEPGAGQLSHIPGGTDVDRGVEGIAEPQFQPGAKLVADPAVQLRPAVGSHDEVHPVLEHPQQHRVQRSLQRLELLLERAPAVDDQENVPKGVLAELAGGTHLPGRPPWWRSRARQTAAPAP